MTIVTRDYVWGARVVRGAGRICGGEHVRISNLKATD